MPSIPKVLLSSSVVDRFKSLQDGDTGNLYGHFHDGNLFVLGFGVPTPEQLKDCEKYVKSIPAGIQICGAFTVGESVQEAQVFFQRNFKDLNCYDRPIFFSNIRDNIQSVILLDNTLTTVTFDIVSKSQLALTFIYFHTIAEFTITCEKSQQYLQIAFDDIRKKVMSDDIAFHIPTKNVYLSGEGGEKIFSDSGINADFRVKDLLQSHPERGSKDYDIVPTQVHLKLTKEFEHENIHNTVPYIRQIRRLIGPFQSAKIPVKVDVMTLAVRNAKIGSVYNVLKTSFLHGMNVVEAGILEEIASRTDQSLSAPEIYNFFPAQSSFFISTVYAKKCSDGDLRKQRELLHHSFGFPLDQPLFRRSQAHMFSLPGSNSGPLTNPHEGLKSGVKGGQVSLVKGRYKYHHYMQDRFDDNGWGCAYRSLQTIVSWFRLQGYAEVEVPTHKQIQECLVKIGDKQSSFIGSRQWIGSTEVSFVLETLLGVTSKILTASTGEEVGCLGSELQYHFQTHGTPIMIGGGVLAHTIIGVDYNRSSGDIKFLILDPHYTGGEDLGVITGKGWVGWKDVKFWTKNAFYNLCLPLRPVNVI